jgi:hypothetical protein
MSNRLTTRIEEWIEAALAEQALGDRVTWDCSFALTPEGPQMLVAFFMPSAILGQMVQSGVVLQNVPQACEYDLQQTVKRVLEDLRAARSEQAKVDGQQPLFQGIGG